MDTKSKKPATVRLSNQQYEEMKNLGFTSESTYVKFKMEQGASKLKDLKNPMDSVPSISSVETNDTDLLKDQLTIQRLSMENQKLSEKLEELSKHNDETLSGVSHKVHSMLQEELQKRDFENLKKSEQKNEKRIDELEQQVAKATKKSEAKQEEIEALVKKLGFVEVGKALLPSAISGLVKQYPTQMKGIAGTLGRLGVSDAMDSSESTTDNQQQEQLTHICNYLQEVCSPAQFQEVMELLFQLGEQVKQDDGILKKVAYYLQQAPHKKTNNQEDTSS